MPRITLENIHTFHGDTEILKGINYVFENEITALIGPSGAGKTTLLKLLNGLHSPAHGKIYIDDNNIDDMNLITLRKQVGIALQSAPMIKGTVYDNLNLPKSLFNDTLDKVQAVELLKEVNLDHIDLEHDVKHLSGGERQRLSIARTLVNRPSILLLDEITSSLDPRSVREVERLIHNIRHRYQPTIIWITHDVEQTHRATDRYVMLSSGLMIHSADSRTLLNSDNQDVAQFVKGEYE